MFDSIESNDKVSANAQVEGILCSVSSMQNPKRGSKRYFHGQISDGTKRMRLVGFEDQSLQDFDAAKSPVKISECEVQISTYNGELEIKLTSKSAILKSPKKFDSIFESHSSTSPVFIQVSEVYNRANSDRVSLKISDRS